MNVTVRDRTATASQQGAPPRLAFALFLPLSIFLSRSLHISRLFIFFSPYLFSGPHMILISSELNRYFGIVKILIQPFYLRVAVK